LAEAGREFGEGLLARFCLNAERLGNELVECHPVDDRPMTLKIRGVMKQEGGDKFGQK
jgi:hypothetical protein